MRKLAATAALAGLLALAACGSSAPNQRDVAACNGLKGTIAKLPNGTVGNAGNEDEVALMAWQATASSPKLLSYIRALEQSLVFANPGAGNFSQLGYDTEDAAVKEIGLFCSGDGVNGIANGW